MISEAGLAGDNIFVQIEEIAEDKDEL